MKAKWPGYCRLCGQDILVGEEIVPRKGEHIHKTCAPGQDEE